MSIDRAEAKEIFWKHIGGDEADARGLMIVDEKTIEREFGWVFFYQNKEYLQSGDISKALLGNVPCLVAKDDGSVWPLGLPIDIDILLAEFQEHGSIDYKSLWERHGSG